MGHGAMRPFRFDGTSLEEIHAWMQGGAGLRGVARAVETLEAMAADLRESQVSLQAALREIGVGWVGTAGAEAGGSVDESQLWSAEATPVVAGSTVSTQNVGDDFSATRSRMPTPQEAELTTIEHVAASSVPIAGPLVDQMWADLKRDHVTNEARQRMNEWQAAASASVGSVRPLPPVPQPVVEAAPTQPAGTEALAGPGSARTVTTTSGQFAGAGPDPVARPVPAAPPLPPRSAPPVVPPRAPSLPRAAQPQGQPAGGQGFVPLPFGGTGPGTAQGRRRAFGPGMYSAEDIARARGGPEARGVAPVDGPQARSAGRGPGGLPAEGPVRGGQEGAATRGGARGGSLLQPAVGGGGARGEEDREHSVRYTDLTDKHFTEGIQRVAPPVIGG